MKSLEIKGRLYELEQSIDGESDRLGRAVGRLKAEAGLMRWEGTGLNLFNLGNHFDQLEQSLAEARRSFDRIKRLIREKADAERRLAENT